MQRSILWLITADGTTGRALRGVIELNVEVIEFTVEHHVPHVGVRNNALRRARHEVLLARIRRKELVHLLDKEGVREGAVRVLNVHVEAVDHGRAKRPRTFVVGTHRSEHIPELVRKVLGHGHVGELDRSASASYREHDLLALRLAVLDVLLHGFALGRLRGAGCEIAGVDIAKYVVGWKREEERQWDDIRSGTRFTVIGERSFRRVLALRTEL